MRDGTRKQNSGAGSPNSKRGGEQSKLTEGSSAIKGWAFSYSLSNVNNV